jgi:transketolase
MTATAATAGPAAPIPLSARQSPDHAALANCIRALAMDAVEQAKSGHPGMPMGMADVATVLWTRFLKFDASRPDWPDRDRFVLSAGHGSMLLYALLHLTGFADMTIDEIKRFRQLGSRTAGHPEYGHAAGIETTTGPLGQGLGNAVGMALAERVLAARFGKDLADHFTYVIAGDGCLMEGISHEAISLAGHLRLNKLIVLFDDNSISIDGPTSLAVSDDQIKRFAASGWATQAIDGHDPEAIAAALEQAQKSDRPSLIACRTTIAYGAPTKAGTAASHGAPLGAQEIATARERLNWPHPAFVIPDDLRARWRASGARGAAVRTSWEKRLAASDRRADFARAIAGDLPQGWQAGLDALKAKLAAEKPSLATRVASQQALDAIVPAVPELIGGSADLTGSNNTKAKSANAIAAGLYGGRYIFYGVREHGMAAAMNGLALHGGVIPFGGTFLVFTDYCRPSIRLSAIMGQRVIYVMTHDSIGLGEDGPTHQPVEHLAALRAMPNVLVLRPADAIETAESWQIALEHRTGPSILVLTRQNLPALRSDAGENRSARGAYLLAEPQGARDVTLIGTGSEAQVAHAAAALLAKESVKAAVVSMPSWSLFDAQDESYRTHVLGAETAPRVAVEAGVRQGWEKYLGARGAFVGMTGFGASAPAADLYRHFGITAEAVAQAARTALGR